MKKKQKFLITGGAGFIASHIIDRLVDENEIIVFDNLHRNSLKYYPRNNHPNIKVIHGDVLNYDLLAESMKDVDVCVHAAAIAGIYSVGESTRKTMTVNLIGVYNALESSIKNSVKKFIDFSTSEVYGPFVFRGKETGSTTLGPLHEKRWVYAVSKLASEFMTHSYGSDSNLEVSSVRPFNVYGPRQIGEGAIQQFIQKALRNEDLILYNDGTQIRSWCYVTDFVDGVLKMIESDNANGEVFNIGNPQCTITNLNLAKAIIKLTNSKSKLIFKPHPGPEVEMRIPDIDKAKTILDYTPEVDLETGLECTIKWFQEFITGNKKLE